MTLLQLASHVYLSPILDSLSSDLLDAYDAHFERMSQLYEQRKPLLDAYEKWLAFCNDFLAFTVSVHGLIRGLAALFSDDLESINGSWSFSSARIQRSSRRA